MASPGKFHLVFSLIMGEMMVFLMTFLSTSVNLGFGPDLLTAWARVFVIASVIAAPVIFFLAAIARKRTGGLPGVHP
ncbi:MAG: DUF2798 domain-containing protein [Paracoccaceae bacterium]